MCSSDLTVATVWTLAILAQTRASIRAPGHIEVLHQAILFSRATSLSRTAKTNMSRILRVLTCLLLPDTLIDSALLIKCT